MRTSLLLWALSICGLLATALIPAYGDYIIVATALVLASLYLVLRDALQARKARKTAARRHVVIDGSNVMHWQDDVPKIETVRLVVDELIVRGFQPGVIFDANAGYKITDRYLDDRHFARLLDLPGDQVLGVPKGNPADPIILAAARENNAEIVTNDRFRDWSLDFPEVRAPGHLVQGGFRQGALWLDEAALTGPTAMAAH